MDLDIKLEGLDQMAEALGAKLADVLPAAVRGVKKAAETVRDTAQDYAPVDTGELREKIHVTEPKIKGDAVETSVVAGAEHSVYVEYGTGIRGAGSKLPAGMPLATYASDWNGQVAQPFMYPAYKQHEKKIPGIIADEVRKAVKK